MPFPRNQVSRVSTRAARLDSLRIRAIRVPTALGSPRENGLESCRDANHANRNANHANRNANRSNWRGDSISQEPEQIAWERPRDALATPPELVCNSQLRLTRYFRRITLGAIGRKAELTYVTL